jgi:hypothetical protein
LKILDKDLKNVWQVERSTQLYQYRIYYLFVLRLVRFQQRFSLYPIEALTHSKYFQPVKRIDSVYGDRNLF